MKSFDQRWKQLANKAHKSNPPDSGPAKAPQGFAARVVARARAHRADESVAAELFWLARIRRAFFAVAAVGLVMVALELSTNRPRRIPVPGIENTVAQLLWRL